MSKTTSAARPPGVPDFTRERCKQCGICAHFCPKGAIELDADQNPRLVHPEACTACMLCEYLCPDFGVRVRADARNDATNGGGEAATGESLDGVGSAAPDADPDPPDPTR